ncbi:TetR family transcriptional regulator [Streptomyces sp. NPDC001193]
MFHRSGYANATLLEIAVFAGVTKGALYCHFFNREHKDLFFAELGHILETAAENRTV